MSLILRCEKCSNSMEYGRDIDEHIPANVAVLSQSQCIECHDGDRIIETWLDADGAEVIPA